jgi:hypothetical protein
MDTIKRRLTKECPKTVRARVEGAKEVDHGKGGLTRSKRIWRREGEEKKKKKERKKKKGNNELEGTEGAALEANIHNKE